MSHFGVAVEYALHILTQLARFTLETPPSAKALAEFQGIPPAYLAKIMTSL
jgi:DNA-binding IscR family transcriptional regulator